MAIFLDLWNSHPLAILSFLGVFDLFLVFYCVKGLNKLRGDSKHSRRAQKKVRELHKISKSNAPLFDVKKKIDDRDPAVAIRALYLLLKKKHSVSYDKLRSITALSFKHRTVLAACFMQIAQSPNYTLLSDLLKDNEAPWVCVLALKALCKAQIQDLLPVLINAQEHSAQEVQDYANHVLNTHPQFQRFAS